MKVKLRVEDLEEKYKAHAAAIKVQAERHVHNIERSAEAAVKSHHDAVEDRMARQTDRTKNIEVTAVQEVERLNATLRHVENVAASSQAAHDEESIRCRTIQKSTEADLQAFYLRQQREELGAAR